MHASPDDAVDVPRFGEAFEITDTDRGKCNAGPCDEILDCAGCVDHSGIGKGGDASTHVYSDSREIVSTNLALAGVNTDSDADAQVGRVSNDCLGAADGTRGSVEGREKAVAGGVHLLSAKGVELAAHNGIVMVEQFAPYAVADLSKSLGRTDNVGEDHRC